MRRTALVALVMVLSLAAGCIGGQDDEAARVTLADDGFGKPQVTIDVGQRIVWTNEADRTWTLSAEQQDDNRSLDLGELEPGNRTVHSFDRAGTYEVIAEGADGTREATMLVEVQQAGGPGPTY